MFLYVLHKLKKRDEAAPNWLAQAEIFSALIAETVSIFCENDHVFDVCELFEGSSDFSLHAPIRANAARVEAAAEFQRRRSRLRHCASHVQGDDNVTDITNHGFLDF